MQTTLLGTGIAVILALLAALVGPYFVDWNAYRSFFETRASSALGMPVRITGPIDARLLPVPSVTLRGLSARGLTGDAALTASELSVEFALGALVRGEWRATEMRLSGPEAKLAFDSAGRLDWAGASVGIRSDAFSIDRLSIEQGRITIADARSGRSGVLDRFWFTGDVRSLIGPLKGEGGFAIDGAAPRAYRVVAGRAGDDGMRLRFSLDPADSTIGGEADGMLSFENGTPHFNGTFVATRLPGVVMSRGRAVNSEPWRFTSRIKAAPTGALLEQVELQYGAEERALKLTGSAELKLGAQPRLEAAISARQLDLDRLVALPAGTRRVPLVTLRAVSDALGEALLPGLALRLGVGVDQATIGGAAVQGLRGEIVTDERGWNVEKLEFRAPGFAQVRTSGRLAWVQGSASFTGPASIDAADPKSLFAWLEGRTSTAPGHIGPLRASGDMTWAADRIAVERLTAELDRKSVSGRLAYTWNARGRQPKLDAELKAAELDLDAAIAMFNAAAPGVSFEVPAELALALEIERATLAGVEAVGTRAKLTLDATGLDVRHLAVRDLAGAGLQLSGRIAGPWATPRGNLTLDLSGQRLDGALALLEKFAPQWSSALRATAPQLAPTQLRFSLAIEPGDRTAELTRARLKIDGSAGGFRLAAGGDLTGTTANWQNADLNLDAKLDAADGRAFTRMFGIERAAAPGVGAGSLRLSARGPLSGDLQAQSQLTLNGADVSASGTLRWNASGVHGQGNLTVALADAVALRDAAGRSGAPAPLAFRASLGFDPARVALDQIAGRFGSSTIAGRLEVALGQVPRVSGRIEADVLDAGALFSSMIGMPAAGAPVVQSIWPAQPFADRFLAGVDGKIELAASRATLTPALEIRQLQALVRLDRSESALEDVKGTLAGGRLLANFVMPRGADGTSLAARIALTGADAAQLVPGDARPPITGRVSWQIEAKGSGRSPASLAGSLAGSGTVSLEGVELSGLDPSAFDVATRAVDQGVGVEGSRIRTLAESALSQGRLRIAGADGALALAAGQLRVGSLLAKGDRADLGVNATIDLAYGTIDARLALIGRGGADGPAAGRPEIFIALKGPVAAPQRTVDVSALVGWLTLRAVDMQAKRLDALEAERRDAEAAQAAAAAQGRQMAPPSRPARPDATSAPLSMSPLPSPSVPVAAYIPPVTAPVSAFDPSATAATTFGTGSPSAASGATASIGTSAPPQPAAKAPPAFSIITPEDVPLPRPRPGATETPAQPALIPAPRRAPPLTVEQAPALPAPIDIRPAPGQRRSGVQPAPRQGGAAGQSGAAGKPRPPATIPPPPRSPWLDLFGAAR